jgi:hypothetical protein
VSQGLLRRNLKNGVYGFAAAVKLSLCLSTCFWAISLQKGKVSVQFKINLWQPTFFNFILVNTTCRIITGLFISLKMHYENVSEKEPIFADEGDTKQALHA